MPGHNVHIINPEPFFPFLASHLLHLVLLYPLLCASTHVCDFSSIPFISLLITHDFSIMFPFASGWSSPFYYPGQLLFSCLTCCFSVRGNGSRLPGLQVPLPSLHWSPAFSQAVLRKMQDSQSCEKNMVTSKMEFRASSSNLPNPKSVCSTWCCFILVSCLAYYWTLKIESFSELSVDSHHTKWCYISYYITLHNHHCVNLNSNLP